MGMNKVLQSGEVTPNNLAIWTTDGVIEDSGHVLSASSPALSATSLVRNDIPTVAIGVTTFIVAGNLTAGDAGARAMYTSVGAGPTSPMAIQDANGTWFQLVLGDIIEIGWFESAGNTTAMFDAFIANVSGRTGLLADTTYTLESLPAVTMLNHCKLLGVPGGGTEITGSYGYTLWEIGPVIDVSIENIKFNNQYSNPVNQGADAVLHVTQGTNINNLRILHCEFTCPLANISCIIVAPRITTETTTAVGVWIQNCNFHDCGSAGIVIFNRNFTAGDKFTACSQIYIDNNRCSNMGIFGLANLALPSLVSFDGVGSCFTANYNQIAGCTEYFGIENTGFINGTINGNSSTDGSGVFVCDGSGFAGDNRMMTGLTCVGNTMVISKANACTLSYVADSLFANNHFYSDTRGMSGRGVQNCTFVQCWFVMTDAAGDFAMLMENGSGAPSSSFPCKNNRLYACLFSNAPAVSTTTVLFSGANITNNILDAMCQFVGSGGTPILFFQASSAIGNGFGNSLPSQSLSIYNPANFVSDISNESYTMDWESNVATLNVNAIGSGTVRNWQLKIGGTVRIDYGTFGAGVIKMFDTVLANVQFNAPFMVTTNSSTDSGTDYYLPNNGSSGSNLGAVGVTNGGGGWWLGSNDGTKALRWGDSGAQLGFFGTAPQSKPTVSGAKGGNAALTSLMTALAALGLVTDTTT